MSLVPEEEPETCRGSSGRSDVVLSTRRSAQRECVRVPFGVERLIVSVSGVASGKKINVDLNTKSGAALMADMLLLWLLITNQSREFSSCEHVWFQKRSCESKTLKASNWKSSLTNAESALTSFMLLYFISKQTSSTYISTIFYHSVSWVCNFVKVL